MLTSCDFAEYVSATGGAHQNVSGSLRVCLGVVRESARATARSTNCPIAD